MDLIFLTGMPGAGKTTIASLLARELQCRFVDLDEEIQQRMGKLIPQIFTEEGEAPFRDCESSALADACQMTDVVVALGAGVLERDHNFERVIASGMLVYLRVGLDTLVERNHSVTSRPLLVNTETNEDLRVRLTELLARREQRYLAAPIILDEVRNQSARETAERVLWALSSHAAR